MGWAYCGKDSEGRDIGYSIEATCDYPGCDAEIDRGLAYACGGMHGQEEVGCERYFCPEHLSYWEDENGKLWQVCKLCYYELEKEG